MGKKILKRSLIIGSLMTFVITGNTWAGEGSSIIYNKYMLTQTNFENALTTNDDSELIALKRSGGAGKYISCYCKVEEYSAYPNLLISGSDGEFTTNRNALYLFAGVNSKRYGFIHSNATTNGNILRINHNIKFNQYTELCGGAVDIGAVDAQDKVVKSAICNRVEVIGESNKMIEIEVPNSSIMIFAGMSNSDVENAYLERNNVEIRNMKLQAKEVSVSGAEVRTSGDVIKNIVTIENARFNVEEIAIYGATTNSGSALNNVVNIKDVEMTNASFYGGSIGKGGAIQYNILNIGGYIKGNINNISNFGTINYDNLKWDTKGTVIETNELELDDSEQIKVNVKGLAEGSTPQKGDVMTLLDTGKVTYDNQSFDGKYLEESTSTFNSGAFLKAEGKIYQEDEDIKLKITRVGTNDQALVIGESRAAATAFANQGSELIEISLDSLARDKSEKETKVFASVFGNASEYATGSHVKVNGWSGIVGVAKTNDDGLTKGAFFENGEGNYRTFNNFKGDFMRGDGEANYNGGGFFVRKDNSNGVYTEASLRAGNLQNELHKAIVGSEGLAGYDIDTFYYGAHLGVGKIIPRGNEGDSIDIYGKFIYTHHDSEDFTIDGDEFHFDSVDSERLRLGFRINEVQNKKLNMYYGAAWEYEFGGDADNTVVSYDLSTPSLSGSTVIGEIGMHYKASEKWSVDINGRAYTGQRAGFTGSVQANYAF